MRSLEEELQAGNVRERQLIGLGVGKTSETGFAVLTTNLRVFSADAASPPGSAAGWWLRDVAWDDCGSTPSEVTLGPDSAPVPTPARLTQLVRVLVNGLPCTLVPAINDAPGASAGEIAVGWLRFDPPVAVGADATIEVEFTGPPGEILSAGLVVDVYEPRNLSQKAVHLLLSEEWKFHRRVQLDVPKLYARIDEIRKMRTMPWREVARSLGVSPSLFTRMKDGHAPSADAVLAIFDWIEADRWTGYAKISWDRDKPTRRGRTATQTPDPGEEQIQGE